MAGAIGNALSFETDYDRHEQRHHARLASGRKLRVLHLFSGPAPHELQKEIEAAAALYGAGAVEVVNLDLLEGFDILDDAKFFDILKRALRGEFDFIVSGTPCCTFSAALAATSDAHNAGTVLRSASSPMGRPNLSDADQKKVDDHNEITLRGVVLELAVWLSGGEAITENPAFRGDESSRFYWKEKAHVGGLLWKMPCIQRLQRATGASKVDFAQCAFKARSQKATTLLYTPGLNMVEFHKIGNGLRERQQCDCAAGAHKITALGEWSAASARYPTLMNRALAKAIVLSFKARRDERERVKKYPPLASLGQRGGPPMDDWGVRAKRFAEQLPLLDVSPIAERGELISLVRRALLEQRASLHAPVERRAPVRRQPAPAPALAPARRQPAPTRMQELTIRTVPGEKLGIHVNGSNEVTSVRPGLAADAAGIRVGDVLQNLQKVDGTTISTRAELKEALKAADVPEEHRIRVLRAPSTLPQAPDIDTPPPPPRAQTKRRAEADAGVTLSQRQCVCQWCVDDPTRHCFACSDLNVA